MDYKNKNREYFGNIRTDLIQFADFNKVDLKILEIGSAYCETLDYLKKNDIASVTVGVDLFEDIDNIGKYKEVDRMIFGNIEELEIPEYSNYFDVIILADVLEHIFEPAKVLNKVNQYLSKDGFILVSMPNIRHFSAFKKIVIQGTFEYEESGIFDYTHVRFYCRKDIKKLLESSKFKVIKQKGSIETVKGVTKTKIINILTFGIFKEFFSYQYLFKAIKEEK